MIDDIDTMTDEEVDRFLRDAGIDPVASYARCEAMIRGILARRECGDFKPWWIRRKPPGMLDCTSCGIEKRIPSTRADLAFIEEHAQCRAPTGGQ